MRFESLSLELGSTAPGFTLPGTDGKIHTLDSTAGKRGTVFAFICNHCPFVLHIVEGFAEFAREYQAKGINVVAISSNDVDAFPEDGPDAMKAFAAEYGFTFPYLFDESQETAHAFKAVCTPDFFLYNSELKLVYCGQFDNSRPSTPHSQGPRTELPVTGEDLRAACDALLVGKSIPEPQMPSNGCSLKWKPGNEPEWG